MINYQFAKFPREGVAGRFVMLHWLICFNTVADVQGWLKVIGLFMFQLAINMVSGYRTWNFADVLPMS